MVSKTASKGWVKQVIEISQNHRFSHFKREEQKSVCTASAAFAPQKLAELFKKWTICYVNYKNSHQKPSANTNNSQKIMQKTNSKLENAKAKDDRVTPF